MYGGLILDGIGNFKCHISHGSIYIYIYICVYIYIANKEKIVKPSFYGDVMGIELTDTMCIFMY